MAGAIDPVQYADQIYEQEVVAYYRVYPLRDSCFGFLLALIGYDITGVSWSVILFAGLGYCCFHYTKEPTLAEGEELLVLGDGKQANVTVNINKDLEGKKIKNEDSSHKLFLTDRTLQIDGQKIENAILPYSSIQSVSKDTWLKVDMAIRLVTTDNQDMKLGFGMGRTKKRDLFMAAIEAKSAEAPEVAVPSAEASGGAAPPALPDGDSDQTG